MKFDLVDEVLEQSPDRIVTVKNVTLGEEYLQDHFPKFPVLPGVMMIEALVQAARRMLADRGDARLVLGEVKALRYGRFVKPGEALRVEVSLIREEGGVYWCKGLGTAIGANERAGEPQAEAAAVSGRFSMRPIRATGPVVAAAGVGAGFGAVESK